MVKQTSNSSKLPIENPKINFSDSDATLWAELLFVFLPFLITVLALAYKKSIVSVFFVPEWALAAAILTGQTVVKFISGLMKYGENINLGAVALVISGLIVLLLAPSLAILSFMLVSPTPVLWLGVVQIVFFCISVFFYLLLGKVSEKIVNQFESKGKQQS
jgi:hypothetical protein